MEERRAQEEKRRSPPSKKGSPPSSQKGSSRIKGARDTGISNSYKDKSPKPPRRSANPPNPDKRSVDDIEAEWHAKVKAVPGKGRRLEPKRGTQKRESNNKGSLNHERRQKEASTREPAKAKMANAAKEKVTNRGYTQHTESTYFPRNPVEQVYLTLTP